MPAYGYFQYFDFYESRTNYTILSEWLCAPFTSSTQILTRKKQVWLPFVCFFIFDTEMKKFIKICKAILPRCFRVAHCNISFPWLQATYFPMFVSLESHAIKHYRSSSLHTSTCCMSTDSAWDCQCCMMHTNTSYCALLVRNTSVRRTRCCALEILFLHFICFLPGDYFFLWSIYAVKAVLISARTVLHSFLISYLNIWEMHLGMG